MRHLFQRVLVEPNQEIQELASQVWKNLVENSQLGQLLLAACPYFGTWLCLAMQNAKSSFDPNLLIFVDSARVSKSHLGKKIFTCERFLRF